MTKMIHQGVDDAQDDAALAAFNTRETVCR